MAIPPRRLQSQTSIAHSTGSSPLLHKVALPHGPGRTAGLHSPWLLCPSCGIGSSVSCPQSYDLWKTSLKAENYYSDKPSGRSLIQLLRQPTDPGCSPRSPPPRCLPRRPPPEPTPPCPSRSVLGLPFPGWINSGRSSSSRKTPAPTWSSQNQ